MTTSQLHDEARRLAARRGISVEDARAELGRRGARSRQRKNYGRTAVTEQAEAEAETRKAHGITYWWQDRE